SISPILVGRIESCFEPSPARHRTRSSPRTIRNRERSVALGHDASDTATSGVTDCKIFRRSWFNRAGSSLLSITNDEASCRIRTDCAGAAAGVVANDVSVWTFAIDGGRSTTMNVAHYVILGRCRGWHGDRYGHRDRHNEPNRSRCQCPRGPGHGAICPNRASATSSIVASFWNRPIGSTRILGRNAFTPSLSPLECRASLDPRERAGSPGLAPNQR